MSFIYMYLYLCHMMFTISICASGSSDSPDQLLAEGKRCLAAGDTTGAVEYFQEACGLL